MGHVAFGLAGVVLGMILGDILARGYRRGPGAVVRRFRAAALKAERPAPAPVAYPDYDWCNPDIAPPSLAPSVEAHEYRSATDTPCCVVCGGGRLHPVHNGVLWADETAGPVETPYSWFDGSN
jgi:hypothetical protein